MALSRRFGEMWLWRFVGLLAFGVCSLNVMVLWKSQPQRMNEASMELLVNKLETNAKQSGGNVTVQILKEHLAAQRSAKKQEEELPPKQIIGGLKAKPSKDEVVKSVKQLPFLLADVGGMLDPKKILVLGNRRSSKAFLTIGVPTVKRSKAFYLPDTLRGIIDGLAEEEKSEVVIVVFIADSDENYINHVKVTIEKLFSDEVASGLIQVIISSKSFYPVFRNLPLLFGDSIARTHWRSKQALDYSFLYYYAADLGKYFMQLEDDVLTEKGFLPEIRKFINSRRSPWSTLEFGARGFIGMLYDASSLTYLARYCRVNFFLMPIDWLFRSFNDIWLHGNSKDSIRHPPLFKHIGAYSSLDGQLRKLEDVKKNKAALITVNKLYKDTDNPPATVTTTILDHAQNYPIMNAYQGKAFWGKTIKIGDSVTITLDKAVSLKKVSFISGSSEYPLDSFEDTEVVVSTDSKCATYNSIATSKNSATVDATVDIQDPIKCIKLVLKSVKKDEYKINRWLIIREIGIWVRK